MTLYLQAAPDIEVSHLEKLDASQDLVVQARMVGSSLPFNAVTKSAGASDVWMYWRSSTGGVLPSQSFPNYTDINASDEADIARAMNLLKEQARAGSAGFLDAFPAACVPQGAQETLRLWPGNHVVRV